MSGAREPPGTRPDGASGAEGWRESLRLLEARIARIPDAIRRAAGARPPPLGFEPGAVPQLRVTGVGSSAANARFLAHLLAAELRLPARYVPLGACTGAPAERAREEVLIVFSQGLSPNARLAMAHPRAWKRLIVVTAVTPRARSESARAALAELQAAGAGVLTLPGEDESGLLVRVVGPAAGYAGALRLAQAVAGALGAAAPGLALDVERACAGVRGAPGRLAGALEACGAGLDLLDDPLALLASGDYAELVDNVRFKLLEGLLVPAPPVWELLHFAHGPFQQAFAGRAVLIALACGRSPDELERLGRIEQMLDARRHRLLRLHAELPAPFAIFEHEALANALLLRGLEARRIDAARWPGRGRDAPLYDLAPSAPAPGPDPAAHADASSGGGARDLRAAAGPASAPGPASDERRLEHLTWPELEAQLARGRRTAVVALGATEQHGPHLPFATDTWIASELARRFCARVGEAVHVATLPLGVSSEHLAFPGTLHLAASTLEAVLRDLATSLRAHGFERLFAFSAHGGNAQALRDALPRLRARAAPLDVIVSCDVAQVTARLHEVAGARGVPPEAAGHHAGEVETAVLRALHPEDVRSDRLEPGTLRAGGDAQSLFHPSLRDHAPNGVVGDPRPAFAAREPGAPLARAEAYLEAWSALLVDAYRAAKKRA